MRGAIESVRRTVASSFSVFSLDKNQTNCLVRREHGVNTESGAKRLSCQEKIIVPHGFGTLWMQFSLFARVFSILTTRRTTRFFYNTARLSEEEVLSRVSSRK